MADEKCSLKYRYTFPDFLYYIGLLAIPFTTGMVAVLDKSLAGAVIFFMVIAVSIPVVLRFFCTHCPHYCRDEKRLNCIFFWRFPKFFSQRPGSLSLREKILSVGGPVLVLLYPVYWLVQEPGLFIVYLLSVIVFGASVRRNECPRCIYTDCPANIAQRHRAE
ncbi:MAG: hypothetical protein HUN04_07545 [Desulfobacter sp.]|nr:MAG: hypothetical protein HUN04_07545 [Desulfobacter sp.]